MFDRIKTFKDSDIHVNPSHLETVPAININLNEGIVLPNIGYILGGCSLVHSNPMNDDAPRIRINPIVIYDYSEPATRTTDNRYILPHG